MMKRLGLSLACLAVLFVLGSSRAAAALCPTCAYISGNNTLYSWDTGSNTLATLLTLPAGSSVDSLVFDKHGNIIFDTANSNQVFIFDTTTQTKTLLATLGSQLGDIALEPSGGSILLSGRGNKIIYRIDLTTKASSVLYSGLRPDGIIYDNTGKLFAVLNQTAVAQLDPATGAILKQVGGLQGADGITFSTTTLKLYVGSNDGGSNHGGFYTIPTDLSTSIFTNLPNKNIDGVGTAGQFLYLINWGDCSQPAGCGNAIQYDLTTNQIVVMSGPINDADDIAPLSGLGSLAGPHLDSLSPHTAAANSPTFTMTANGSQFVSGAVVTWNGSNLTTTFISASQLQAAVPAANVQSAGTATVMVVNPDGQPSGTLPFTTTAVNSQPVLTSIRVQPLFSNRQPGDHIAFTAQGYDQYGAPFAVSSFAWSLDPAAGTHSTIDPTSGAYTAGLPNTMPATDSVFASVGVIKGTGTVTIMASGGGLTINSITANPNPVLGTKTNLNVDATSPSGTITYSWGPAGYVFTSLNAPNPTLSFSSPGSYQPQVTVRSPGFVDLTGSIAVEVIQTLSGVVILPPKQVSVVPGTAYTFHAKAIDQWGNTLSNETLVWTAEVGGSPAGSISQSGAFFSNTPIPQVVTVKAVSARDSSKFDTAQITVQEGGGPTDISNAYAYPVPWKSTMGLPYITFTGLARATDIRIFTMNARLVRKLSSVLGEDVSWDLKNADGERVASSVYFYIIDNAASSQRIKGKLVVIQ